MLRIVSFVAMIATGSLSLSAADQFRQILTSAERNIHVEAWKTTARELDPASRTRWSVEKHTLHGGKQEGVDVIVVDNGELRFTVIPTRGMGILRVEMGDITLGWNSPVKEVVHPQLINLQSRGGLGWLDGFNEWLARCGLEFAGHPGKDKFINNVGEEAEMDLTLHGKIANLPASEVEVVIDRKPPHTIRIRGRVDERMFYGPKLELWTEISTEPDASTFRIEDEIVNRGGFDQEFELIYHLNFGPPLLEKGARLVAAVKQVTPFNAHAAQSVASYDEYAGPTIGFIEQVYCLRPFADATGRTTVMLQNAAADRAVSMTFALEQMPYLTLWKNSNTTEEGYVTGIEPGTSFPYNRRIERKAGRVPKLQPGQNRRFTIDFAILSGRDKVESVSRQVKTIRQGQTTQVDAEAVRIE